MSSRALFLTAAFGAAVFVSAPASGQTRAGELRVIVFVGAAPAQGVTVVAGSAAPQSTDEYGAAVFVLPEGQVSIAMTVPRALAADVAQGGPALALATRPVQVVAEESVEVIVTISPTGRIDKLDVETPVVTAAGQREKDPASPPRTGPPGKIRGRLVTGEPGAPVAGARVFVRGAAVEAESDADGSFELELPQGSYDLTIIHPRHATTQVNDVEVNPNRVAELRVRLEKVTAQLEDFVVTAPHIEGGVASLVAERRQSASVDDVIGAEEMSRSGDSDAAGALRRVTGITVIGGQYVYVRGMGERYSATLLNGQMVPSPEPERRVIPLDLFSTDVLESVVIQKTPSADIPGEFGGGMVFLRTKSFPEDLTLSVSASTGVLTSATFQGRPGHDGGSLDFLGFDDGTRALPGEIRSQSPLREGNRFEDGPSREELAALGRLLPNNYEVHDETVPMNVGLGFSIGDRYEPADIPTGFLLSISYDNDHAYSEEDFKRFVTGAGGELALDNDFTIREMVQTIGLSGIFVAGVEPAEGHEIRSTTLLLRISDNETAQVTGRSDDLGADIRQSRLRFVERQLFTEQIAGTHELSALGGGTFEWRYALSQAVRQEPDRREYFYVDDSPDPDAPPSDFQLSARPSGNQRIWNDLDDRVHDIGLDHTQPFTVWNKLQATAKVGGMLMFRDRAYDTVRLTMKAPTTLSPEERRLPAEEIWAPENINADDGWILEDTTQPTDAYTAQQQIQAGYAMVTLPLAETVEATAGIRVERSRQSVVTFDPFSADTTPLAAELDNTDLLPSASTRWQLTGELVLRGSYGRTVTRPDFRELSQSQYRDVVTARRFVGNPDLERGTIDNYDTRLEYYFSPDEVASVAAFYKSFHQPIEQIDRGGVDRSITWDNAESARNIGVEIETRKRFGFLARALTDAFLAVNVAIIGSRVTLDPESSGISTSKERALQGQSPYVVNLQLGYDDAGGSGISAVLLYNLFGPRIRDVGRDGTPDVFEDPFHQLDFVYGHKLGGGWSVKLKARNLLDQELRFSQGDRIARRFRNGREFSISAGWSL